MDPDVTIIISFPCSWSSAMSSIKAYIVERERFPLLEVRTFVPILNTILFDLLSISFMSIILVPILLKGLSEQKIL